MIVQSCNLYMYNTVKLHSNAKEKACYVYSKENVILFHFCYYEISVRKSSSLTCTQCRCSKHCLVLFESALRQLLEQ